MFIENIIVNQAEKVKVYFVETFLMKTKKNDIITCFYPNTIEFRAGKYNLLWQKQINKGSSSKSKQGLPEIFV